MQLCKDYDDLHKHCPLTCCAAQDSVVFFTWDLGSDATDSTVSVPQIKHFICEEVALQLALASHAPEPVKSSYPSLRHVIETQVGQTLPPAPPQLPVAAPLTYAAAVAEPRPSLVFEAYPTTGSYTSLPPSRPVLQHYSSTGLPVAKPWRTFGSRIFCDSCHYSD